jgi:chloramphenicol-sensitive protein RarD
VASIPLLLHAATRLSPDRSGLVAQVSARVMWGASTFYISLSAANDSLRVFEQRIFWAFILMLCACAARREIMTIRNVVGDRAALLTNMAASAIIASNWFVVIWCAKNGALVAAALGFFLAPLLMIVAGAVLFSETPLRGVALSLSICCAGIVLYFWGSFAFPWPVFLVALSTTAYTLLRKARPFPALAANVMDAGLALVGTTFILLVLEGPAALLPPAEDNWLYYPGLGLITAVPMLFYVYSLPNVSMILIGYLQYITPTIIMAIGMLAGEVIRPPQAAGLGLIWLAIVVYLIGRQSHPKPAAAP